MTAICRAVVDRLADAGAHITEVGPVIEPLRPQLEGYWKAGFATILDAIPSDRWDELDPGFRTLAQEGMGFDVHQLAAGPPRPGPGWWWPCAASTSTTTCC